VESLGNYIYAQSESAIWVNLFIGSNATIDVAKTKTNFSIETNYPWTGSVKVKVSPEKKVKFALNIRIPGWAVGKPVPGETYTYFDFSGSAFSILVNGKPATFSQENGYAILNREWKINDVVEVNLPMEPRRVVAKAEVKEDINRVAIERGPLVYCIEHADNTGKAFNIFIPDNAILKAEWNKDLWGGIQTIKAEVPVVTTSNDGLEINTEIKSMTAIPYFLWNNRGQGQMQVWIPRKVSDIKLGTK
jgi:DUF1680 family protein